MKTFFTIFFRFLATTFWLIGFVVPQTLPALDTQYDITQYRVRSWTMEDGLPGNSVFAVLQTGDGYLWIGTQGGLVRFDGLQFETFSRANTPQLKDNVVRALYQSADGTLWLGTYSGGLTQLNNGTFSTFSLTVNPTLSKINSINQDSHGTIWIGSLSSGLTCFRDGTFTTYTKNDGLPGNQVRRIFKDDQRNLWAVTDAGIVKIVEPGDFRIYASQNQLPYYKTSCLYRTTNRELWIGTGDNGLFLLKDDQITSYRGIQNNLHPTINCLFDDHREHIWIGTDGGGLARINRGKVEILGETHPLAKQSVYSIYQDREDNLWVGTLDNGLFRLNRGKFITFTSREGLTHDYVQCIYEKPNGDLLIGTKNGLNRYNMADGTIIPMVKINKLLLNDSVTGIWEDAEGYTWIGSWGGLNRYGPLESKTFTKVLGLAGDHVTCLLGDGKGNIWVGTENGLNRIDISGNIITTYTKNNGLPGLFIKFLAQDSRENIWFGTDGGLCSIDNDIVSTYNRDNSDSRTNYYCMLEDSGGTLWFGSDNGLERRTKKDDQWMTESYTIKSGLADNNVYSILEDDFGYLWLAGANGIWQLDKKQLKQFAQGDITRLTPVWYNKKDGMKSQWCTGTACRTGNGRFYFGTSIGITSIDPRQIQKNKIPPPSIIKKIVVNGKSIPVDSLKSGQDEILELEPGTRRIEFHYTALSYVNPESIRFRLMLEGYDDDWVESGAQRSTIYTGISPGHYRFKLIAGNSDGVWNSEPTTLSFYQQYYFYQTSWFYLSIFIVIVLMAVFFHFYRTHRLRQRKKELTKQVELHTRTLTERNIDLEQARQKIQHSYELIEDKNLQLMEQAEKLKELDEAKSRFFANISHDFRTPLTLIKGPLEQVMAESPGKPVQSKFNMMLRNTNRLLNMVEQLLELAKFDSGRMSLKVSRQSAVSFVRKVVMCFESLAKQKDVELIFRSEIDEVEIYFDPEKLERILFNLLSNAFNYTSDGEKIVVTVGTVVGNTYPDGSIEISVQDTGTGIPSDQLPHIFDRFYRGEGNHEYRQRGTGIGLALARELIELHHGAIEVRSIRVPAENHGTCFTLRLPLGNRHWQSTEIVESTCQDRQHSAIPDYIQSLHHEAEDHRDDLPSIDTVQEDRATILIVDDNPDVRAYIREMVEPYFHILEAKDGGEGFDKAVESMPELVISDVMMPEVDGFEFCARLKNEIRTSHIPVVLLTAKASEKSVIEGFETGADDYITKPFNSAILLSRIKNLVRLRRQLQRKIQKELIFQPTEISISSMDRKFLEELHGFIEKHISDPEYRVTELAGEMLMSQSALYKKVEALTGLSPQLYIRSFRLKRGAQLLKANFGNVTEVAFEVGFSSAPYFTKCFKETFKCLPSEYHG